MRLILVCLLLGGIFLPAFMNAQLSWSKHVYNVGGELRVERADFTGDGFPDLFLYTEDDNIVSILPNTGNGLFDASHVFTMSQRLTDAVLLDFNRDGKIDVVGCSGGFNVVVLLGNGDGTLTPGQSIETPCSWVAAADFNRDGRPDIAVGVVRDDMGTFDNQVVVFLGDGNGGVLGQVVNDNVNFTFSNGDPCFLYPVAEAADFSGDKFADIAMVAECTNGPVSQSALIVGKGDGTGHFAFHKDLEFNLNVHMRLRLNDVDQDGGQDMTGVVTEAWPNGEGSTALLVFKGHGNGTFALREVAKFPVSNGVGNYINSGTVIDLNGDGVKDGIVAVDSVDGGGNEKFSLKFFKGQPNGTYILTETSPLANKVWDMVGADLDKDSRADLALVRPNSTDFWSNQTASVRICGVVDTIPSVYPCYTGSPSGTFHFFATPRDNRAISAIQVYVDGVVKFVTLDDLLDANVQLSDGPHRVTIKAWDDLGAFSSTQTILVCTNPAVRTVRICSPADGSTIKGSTDHITASAFTNRKFIQLQMYTDGRVIFRDSIPYIDQELFPGHGTHRITVKGWDDLGAFSSSVMVTVP